MTITKHFCTTMIVLLGLFFAAIPSASLAQTGPLPELSGLTCQTPATAYWGIALPITAVVQNTGLAPAGPFIIRWYLSQDATLSSDDLPLVLATGADAYKCLELPAQSTTSTLHLFLRTPNALPDGWAASPCYVIMYTDANNEVVEENEDNNCGQAGEGYDYSIVSLSDPLAYMPDLCGYSSNAPDCVQWGSAIRVSGRVMNAGNACSGPAKVCWYLSKDSVYSSDDILLTQTNGATYCIQPALDPQCVGAFIIVYLCLPTKAQAGWRTNAGYIVMRTDCDNEVEELCEDNNSGQMGAGLDNELLAFASPTAQKADLCGAYFDVPNVGRLGACVSATARIHNLGTLGASKFNVRWYLSQDPCGSADDLLLCLEDGSTYLKIDGLKAASLSATLNVKLRLPDALPDTWTSIKYYIVMKTDADDHIKELDENNNFGQIGYNCDWDYIMIPNPNAVMPDIQGQNCYAPASSFWGNAVMIKARVRNAGTADCGAFRVKWFLSQDNCLSGDDIPLTLINGATYYPHAGLAAGTSGPAFSVFARLPVSLPEGWSGTDFFIIMKSDADDQVLEYYENNNSGEIGAGYDWDYLTVQESPYALQADLLGYTCDAPSTAFWGSAVKVVTRISNVGNADSGTFKVRWYLSQDPAGSDDDIPLCETNGHTYYSHANLAALTAGGFVTVYLRMPTVRPDGWASDTVFIVVKSDADDMVPESDETNNFGQVGLGYDSDYIRLSAPFAPMPDLQGLNCYAPASANWGGTIAVQSRVQNTGTGPAGACRVRWYLSQDATGSDDDILLQLQGGGDYVDQAALAAATAGAQFTVNLVLPTELPTGWSGTSFYVIMKTDADAQVKEYYETNNFGQVGLGFDKDVLTITAL